MVSKKEKCSFSLPPPPLPQPPLSLPEVYSLPTPACLFGAARRREEEEVEEERRREEGERQGGEARLGD